MSYLGRGLEQVDNISKLDNITFNGGTTYALTKDSAAFTPISSNAILISIDGVIQQGNFSVSGTNIVFNFSPTGSNTCDFIMHYGTGVAFTPADSSVTKDKANFISTSSAAGLQIKGDGTTDGTLQLNCSQNSHGVKIKSPAHSASQSYTLTLPATAPATDKMLQTNSSGVLSFVDTPSGKLVETGSLYSYTGNGANTMNIDNCFSSTYNMYVIKFQMLPGANAAGLTMRARNSSGSMTGSYYDYVSRSRSTAGTDGEHRGTEQNKIILSDAVTSREYDTGAWGEFYVWINSDESASAAFSCTGTYGVMTSNSGGDTKIYKHASQFQRTVTDAGALTGIQWYWESGNTTQFNIKVYGLEGSNA